MDRMAQKAPKYQDSVQLYIDSGVLPGGFLTAVLENNLMHAFSKADHNNTAMMREWAGWLYNYGHPNVFGSHEIVKQWHEDGGLVGLAMIHYRGSRQTPADGTASEVKVEWSQGPRGNWTDLEHIVHHSPTGMSWGYAGSGPADLAFSILSHHLSDDPAPALYQAFKGAFVVGWGDEWKITSQEISAWING